MSNITTSTTNIPTYITTSTTNIPTFGNIQGGSSTSGTSTGPVFPNINTTWGSTGASSANAYKNKLKIAKKYVNSFFINNSNINGAPIQYPNEQTFLPEGTIVNPVCIRYDVDNEKVIEYLHVQAPRFINRQIYYDIYCNVSYLHNAGILTYAYRAVEVLGTVKKLSNKSIKKMFLDHGVFIAFNEVIPYEASDSYIGFSPGYIAFRDGDTHNWI